MVSVAQHLFETRHENSGCVLVPVNNSMSSSLSGSRVASPAAMQASYYYLKTVLM